MSSIAVSVDGTTSMQAMRLAYNGHCLNVLGGICLSVDQAPCYIIEHVVDAVAGGCWHCVAGCHVDRKLGRYSIHVRSTDHIRRHAVRPTTTQEVHWRRACAVRRGGGHVVNYGIQRWSAVYGVADDDCRWLFVIVGRQWRVTFYARRVP